ncbi:MAG: hypothetical protein ACTTNT_03465 [Arsenophonus sp.]
MQNRLDFYSKTSKELIIYTFKCSSILFVNKLDIPFIMSREQSEL